MRNESKRDQKGREKGMDGWMDGWLVAVGRWPLAVDEDANVVRKM